MVVNMFGLDALSQAILRRLQQAGGILAYTAIVQHLRDTSTARNAAVDPAQIDTALYRLWKHNYISSPGVRWLPERPQSIDGIFDDPAWHTMLVSLSERGQRALFILRLRFWDTR